MPDIRNSAYFQERYRNLLENVKGEYGEDSEIFHFLSTYEVPSGKALVEHRKRESVSLQEAKKRRFFPEKIRYDVKIVASHKYEFGHVVIVNNKSNKSQYICSSLLPENDVIKFFIIDENEIYATKRLQ